MSSAAETRTNDVGGKTARCGLAQLFDDERGEIAPVTYLLALMVTMWFMFFAFDLGLRKGAQISVEYAAFCAARAAAVNFHTYSGGNVSCDAAAAKRAATRAAAACMAAVVGKHAVPNPTVSGAISQLIDRAEQQISVSLDGGCSGNTSVVTAEVKYTHRLEIMLSPLSNQSTPTVMTARAQHMIY